MDAGKAKLTEAQVYEIRRRSDAGESRKTLAAEFNISGVSVMAVALRRSWQHLSEIT